MLLLPKKIGPFTLVRKLGTGGISESYVGVHDGADGRKVVVRRILPYVLRDPSRRLSVEMRIKDLLGIRHPYLVQILEWVEDGEDRYLVEDWVEGIDLERVISWCRHHSTPLPSNVFLHLTTQICNALEALHGRPGKGTGTANVLHLGLMPSHLYITREGKVVVGGYALTRSPTVLPQGGASGPVPARMEYLSPEQTHPDQKLTPASDVFGLGAVLFELLTLRPLFRAESNLQTIHKVRRAEVAEPMAMVRERMPGLDKVLQRALSLNPRHRYQRAFVLREDLRGLMAGYSFANIADDIRGFLRPMFEGSLSVFSAEPPSTPHAAVDPGQPEPLSDEVIWGSIGQDAKPLRAAPELSEEVVPTRDVRQSLGAEAPTERPSVAAEVEDDDDGNEQPTDHEFGFLPSPLPPEQAPASTAAWLVRNGTAEPAVQAAVESTIGVPAPARPEPVRNWEPPTKRQPSFQPDAFEDDLDEAAPVSMSAPLAPPPPSAPPPVFQQAVAPPPPSWGTPRADAPPPIKGPTIVPNSVLSEPPPPPPPPRVAPPVIAPPPPLAAPPPPPRVAPPPVAAPVQFEEDEPVAAKKPNPLVLVGLAAGALVLGLVCAGGVYTLFGGADTETVAVNEIAETPSLEDVEEPTEEAEAAAPEPAEAPPEAPAIAEAEPAPERVVAEAAPPRSSAVPRASTPSEPRASTPSEPRASTPRASSASTPSTTGSSGTTASSSRATSAGGPSTSRSAGTATSSTPTVSSLVSTPVEPLVEATSNPAIEQYASNARGGALGAGDIAALEAIGTSSPDFNRSRALLLMNAEKKGDSKGARRYLGELMQLQENRYNPVYLSKEAVYLANDKRYADALARADLAERHWARTPPELVYKTKLDIYAVQAASYQGLFYASGGDTETLDKALRAWKRYRDHVASKGEQALVTKADTEIAKLEDARVRLE